MRGIVWPMNEAPALVRLQALSTRLDTLLASVHRFEQENRSLRAEQQQLRDERTDLKARSDQAKARVEALILRLRMLEDRA